MHESDFHMLPSREVSETRNLTDTSKLANPVPDIVNETDPDLGELEVSEDTLGDPYEPCIDNIAFAPSTALEIVAPKKRPAPRTTLQFMPESDFQSEVEDALAPKTSFILVENEPMFLPTTVIELHPVTATRCAPIEDNSGTSNESTFDTLPKRELTETTLSLIRMSTEREIFKDIQELAVQRTISA